MDELSAGLKPLTGDDIPPGIQTIYRFQSGEGVAFISSPTGSTFDIFLSYQAPKELPTLFQLSYNGTKVPYSPGIYKVTGIDKYGVMR